MLFDKFEKSCMITALTVGSVVKRIGAAGLGFDFRTGQIAHLAPTVAPAAAFFRCCVAQVLSRGDGSRRTPRRNTASIIKICLFFFW